MIYDELQYIGNMVDRNVKIVTKSCVDKTLILMTINIDKILQVAEKVKCLDGFSYPSRGFVDKKTLNIESDGSNKTVTFLE